jgi:hypothetical protein
VHDASLGPHEVETSLERVASGERKHAVQSVGRQLPQLIGGCRTSCVDHPMSAEPSDETRRRRA